MSAVTVVVRRARRDEREEEARAALLRKDLIESFARTCLYFFCQELTLQCVVLGGAVLFIWGGASPAACCLLLPAAAAAVALAVFCTNIAIFHSQMQEIRGELAGWVAVAPALSAPPQHCTITVQPDYVPEPAGSMYNQVVGTVSVSQHWRTRHRGWLHALHVEPRWRRRGVGAALAGAARLWGVRGGLDSLEGVTTDLQPAARATLHSLGWKVVATYQRRVLATAVTLPVAQLAIDISQDFYAADY